MKILHYAAATARVNDKVTRMPSTISNGKVQIFRTTHMATRLPPPPRAPGPISYYCQYAAVANPGGRTTSSYGDELGPGGQSSNLYINMQ